MTDTTGIDWDDAFANGSYIPDGMTYPETWAKEAAAFRASAAGELDVPYGDRPREVFDLFRPSGSAKGLAVIVHGGYWLNFDKSFWSDLAKGPLAHGWAVAVPSYTLAPNARIGQITKQIAKSITTAASLVAGPIRLTGHSAGGHLVTRMICQTTPLDLKVAKRIEHVVSISGVHDLRPLLSTSMNTNLQLDIDEAKLESPALCEPMTSADVIAWVGGRERPEFLRQSALLVENWGIKGANTRLHVDPSTHHFNVIDGLKDANAPLTKAFVGT